LQQILFIPGQDQNQKVLKSLVEVDLAIELNGFCESSETIISLFAPLPVPLGVLLEQFNEFCEFVKFIISKENLINDKHTDWALSVFAN
jgi:hypothetical protein